MEVILTNNSHLEGYLFHQSQCGLSSGLVFLTCHLDDADKSDNGALVGRLTSPGKKCPVGNLAPHFDLCEM